MSEPVHLVQPVVPSDRECLEAWRRQPGAESLRPVVERYLAFVYSSAYRRTGNPAQAAEVAHAVFLVLARRARKLRKETVLAGWLFEITAVACRKLTGRPKGASRWRWFARRKRSDVPPDASLPTILPPERSAVRASPPVQPG